MATFIVIILSAIILLSVIIITSKSISKGIEARRDLNFKKDKNTTEENLAEEKKDNKVSEELIKLAELHSKGIINDDEFEKAKEKILD